MSERRSAYTSLVGWFNRSASGRARRKVDPSPPLRSVWRDFAQGIEGTYDWEAAYIGVIRVELLGTGVNERWRNEPCPGKPLPADDEDRATRRS
jgi:hypothetical protein